MRQGETYKTWFRETAGFTLGFVVLRQIERLIRNQWMKPALGVHTINEPKLYSLKTAWADLKKTVAGKGTVSVFEPNYTATPELDYTVKGPTAFAKRAVSTMQSIAKTLGFKSAGTQADKALLAHLFSLGPVILSSVPAVALAGIVLEKVTQNYSATVINKLTGQEPPQTVKTTVSKKGIAKTEGPSPNTLAQKNIFPQNTISLEAAADANQQDLFSPGFYNSPAMLAQTLTSIPLNAGSMGTPLPVSGPPFPRIAAPLNPVFQQMPVVSLF